MLTLSQDILSFHEPNIPSEVCTCGIYLFSTFEYYVPDGGPGPGTPEPANRHSSDVVETQS